MTFFSPCLNLLSIHKLAFFPMCLTANLSQVFPKVLADFFENASSKINVFTFLIP